MFEPIPYDIIADPNDEPLVLSGPPGKLTGQVKLKNPGDVKVVLRDASLKDSSGVLNILSSTHILPTLVLRPNQGRIVTLTAAVNPTTPPGEYHAMLDIAGWSRPVVLHVAEVFDLKAQPQSIVVGNRLGEAQRKRVIVTNGGNVAFIIGDIGKVDLKDDMILDSAIRVAIEPLVERSDIDIEKLVEAVLRVVREKAYRVDSLSVRNLGGNVVVGPGETVAIDLEFTLREELPNNSRYRGRVPLLTQDLEIIVVSSSDYV